MSEAVCVLSAVHHPRCTYVVSYNLTCTGYECVG